MEIQPENLLEISEDGIQPDQWGVHQGAAKDAASRDQKRSCQIIKSIQNLQYGNSWAVRGILQRRDPDTIRQIQVRNLRTYLYLVA